MLIRCWVVSLSVVLLFACSPPRGVYHTVQKGQTLYQIAKTYQVEPERISRINHVSDPSRLAIGDRLFIPGATRVRSVRPTVTEVTKPVVRSNPPAPVVKPVQRPPVRSIKPTAAPSARTQRQPVGKPQLAGKPVRAQKRLFQWPVKGKVIKSFGSKPATTTGNGIEIAIRSGSPVKSAAAGKVIYSGNGIPGYGNLVIIQHDDALYSVYGFNRKNLVEAGSFVSQGQQIALSGTPPSGGVPRLYFEARSGKNPVNPIFYLP
ncbi:MAG TPA: M23 family metallopeptidase [Geothermobacteraceae bacterium]|nr:M23 family metallopeptidase [Geothermobacteraceae bacterium]